MSIIEKFKNDVVKADDLYYILCNAPEELAEPTHRGVGLMYFFELVKEEAIKLITSVDVDTAEMVITQLYKQLEDKPNGVPFGFTSPDGSIELTLTLVLGELKIRAIKINQTDIVEIYDSLGEPEILTHNVVC